MTFPPLLPGVVDRLDRFAGPFSLTRCIAIAIAITSLITAGVASLQENASANGSAAARNTERYAVIGASDAAAGQARVNYDYNAAYKQWESLNFQALQAELTGDLDRADRLKAQRDAIEPLTPLLSDLYRSDFKQLLPGYFIGSPDRYSYESDLCIRSTAETGERYSLAARQQAAWSAKGTKFVRQLAFLGVALFLLGLSATLPSRRTQKGFLALGIVVASIAAVQVVSNMSAPIPEVSEAALQRYADAQGLEYKALDDPTATEKAIAAYGDAIRLQPDYAHAYLARADAVAGSAGGTVFETAQVYDKALADYKRALDNGSDDLTVAREARTASARLNYNLGRFDESIKQSREVLRDDPEQLAVRFQLMLALVAKGDADGGLELQRALTTARSQVEAAAARGAPVSPIVWFDLERAAQRLSGLVERVDAKGTASIAPPLDSMPKDKGPLRSTSVTFYSRIKDETIALERRPPEQVGVNVDAKLGEVAFACRPEAACAALQTSSKFPYGTQAVRVIVQYGNLQPGQRVTMKVYAGIVFEARELRKELRHNGPSAGQLQLEVAYQGTRNLPPGDIKVELYIENHLVSSSGFTIQPATRGR